MLTNGSSAPVFSLIGFIVRLRGTNDPDVDWSQPNVIMWG